MEQTDILIDIITMLSPNDVKEIVDENVNIIDDLGYDSLAMVELLNKIEETFGVDFTELPDFLERFERVGDIREGIEKLMG